MIRAFALIALALALSAPMMSEAQAKRRGIPIPGSSQTIVKVLDLPDTAPLRRDDGTYVDLGYLFNVYYGGEWIGYIGSSTNYLKLDEEALAALLQVAGVNALPAVPERPIGSQIMAIVLDVGLVVIVLSVLAALLMVIHRGLRQTASAARRPGRREASQGSVDADATSKPHLNGPAPVPRFAAAARGPALGVSGRPQFGRRGL